MNTHVERVREIPVCPRCGSAGLMACTLPQGRAAGSGEGAQQLHVLCERCDIDDPAAGMLVAFMAVHVPVPPERSDELAGYIRAWIDSLHPRPNPDAQRAEWEAYKLGVFDDDSSS